jgi:hypothetical protein
MKIKRVEHIAIAELKAKQGKLQSETWRNGHGGSKIVFLASSATGNVVVDLTESVH